jgi:hypothetical protein
MSIKVPDGAKHLGEAQTFEDLARKIGEVAASNCFHMTDALHSAVVRDAADIRDSNPVDHPVVQGVPEGVRANAANVLRSGGCTRYR